jgi:hypothetical protein
MPSGSTNTGEAVPPASTIFGGAEEANGVALAGPALESGAGTFADEPPHPTPAVAAATAKPYTRQWSEACRTIRA